MQKQTRKENNALQKTQFSKLLLQWNREKNRREMPWKGEKDPYKIWLSEIILQQTRVEQGLAYYHRFIETFPGVHQLAKAPDAKVFKLWEGLGYYTRCRNLIHTARYISRELKGVFPASFEEIIKLKGVGPYTAAAISSFAFNLPHAVIDGNVFRVLSRVFGIVKPVDSTQGKRLFTQLANDILDKNQAGIYNQAIMDFGAVVCKPFAPLCSECVFNKSCFAFLNGKVNELPVKAKKVGIRKRWLYFLVIEHENKTAIRQRTSKDIWQQLYEFPVIESSEEQSSEMVLMKAEKQNLLQKKQYQITAISPLFKQQLSHQLIAGQFLKVTLKKRPDHENGIIWVTGRERTKFAFPGFINQYLRSDKKNVLF